MIRSPVSCEYVQIRQILYVFILQYIEVWSMKAINYKWKKNSDVDFVS